MANEKAGMYPQSAGLRRNDHLSRGAKTTVAVLLPDSLGTTWSSVIMQMPTARNQELECLKPGPCFLEGGVGQRPEARDLVWCIHGSAMWLPLRTRRCFLCCSSRPTGLPFPISRCPGPEGTCVCLVAESSSWTSEPQIPSSIM